MITEQRIGNDTEGSGRGLIYDTTRVPAFVYGGLWAEMSNRVSAAWTVCADDYQLR